MTTLFYAPSKIFSDCVPQRRHFTAITIVLLSFETLTISKSKPSILADKLSVFPHLQLKRIKFLPLVDYYEPNTFSSNSLTFLSQILQVYRIRKRSTLIKITSCASISLLYPANSFTKTLPAIFYIVINSIETYRQIFLRYIAFS